MKSITASASDPVRQWASFRLRYAMDRLRLALKAYDPGQPRAPLGTDEGGQRVSPNTELHPTQVAGGFGPEHMDMKVHDFIAQMCKGSIHGALPREFLPMTIRELLAQRKAGVENADTCFKLLHRNVYRK